MKKLLVCILLILPVMAQAEVSEWKEIGATDSKTGRVVHYNAETLILDSGLECTVISTGFSKYGIVTWGGGGSCNFQLYNCLYHNLGCSSGGSSGTIIYNGSPDIDINKRERRDRN